MRSDQTVKCIELNRHTPAGTAPYKDLDSLSLITSYFQWLLEANAISFCIIAPRPRNLIQKFLNKENNPSRHFGTLQDIERNILDIERAAQDGFRLLIAFGNTLSEQTDFLAKYGFITSDAEISDVSDTPLLKAAWNKAALEEILHAALKKHKGPLCCISHDADPIYIFEQVSKR